MKRNINIAILYTFIAIAGGVFYREFTKWHGFGGRTTLSVIHTHYFMLGTIWLVLIFFLENILKHQVMDLRSTALYQIGLNLTGFIFLVHGILQVLNVSVSTGISAAISGVAGVGHILLAFSIIWILLRIRRIVTIKEGNS